MNRPDFIERENGWPIRGFLVDHHPNGIVLPTMASRKILEGMLHLSGVHPAVVEK